MTAQMYLLNARTLMQMAEAVQGDAKTKARIRFAVQQWVDAAARATSWRSTPRR
jgi:polyhydroxyalkanoate synthase